MHERALVLAGTSQGCIDLYDARHWTIYRSHKHFGCAINQMVLPTQRRFRLGSANKLLRSRRSSLPASFLGKRHNQRIYVGLACGRIVSAPLSDIIEDMTSQWEDLKIPNTGTVNKLLIEENSGFTQGYVLCGRNCVTQFTRVDDGLTDDSSKR